MPGLLHAEMNVASTINATWGPAFLNHFMECERTKASIVALLR